MLKNKKFIIAVKIVAFVLIFCLMAEGMGMLVYPKTGETTPKMVLYRQQKETPDVLMLGTSAMFRAIMPLLMDEITGLDTVDMCTPAQTMLSSYTLLKDSIKQGKVPETLILYTNIRRFCREKSSNYDFQVMANLPLSLDKLEMMYHGFSMEEWPETLLNAVRGRENFTLKAMKRNLRSTYKISSNPEEAPEELRPYIGKGYNYDTRKQDPAAVVLPNNAVEVFSLAKADRTWYDKIAALCKEHNIDLILLAVPRLPATILASEDYDGYHKYMQQLADETGAQFWDLTYLKEDVMVVTSEHFRDGYHGNTSFAEPFTRVLGAMVKEHKAGTLDVSKYLYDDYETYTQLHQGVQAIFTKDKLQQKDDIRNYLDVSLIVGANTDAEYRVLVALEDTEEYVLFQDWSQEPRVVFGKDSLPDGRYDVKIEARPIGGEVQQTLVKPYTIK